MNDDFLAAGTPVTVTWCGRRYDATVERDAYAHENRCFIRWGDRMPPFLMFTCAYVNREELTLQGGESGTGRKGLARFQRPRAGRDAGAA